MLYSAFSRVRYKVCVFCFQESTDIEKGVSIEEKPAAEGHDAWNYHSSTEVIIFGSFDFLYKVHLNFILKQYLYYTLQISQRPKSTYSSYNMPSTSSQEQRLSYMSSSFGSGAASLSSIHPSTHNHPNKTSFLHER